ncbi:MAG: hypothetical protein CL920_20215 [Deltaproteobacteria bacterium]|nr:hypothetical protein [Deltaproteobacteria bacterium]MBU51017.1 hypothetical protein [Deltaproteobacteria bacterium]|tara:strand:+ start:16561 stop:19926 length:3366 start_codon:yes stop_codon:yes gene_type:complete
MQDRLIGKVLGQYRIETLLGTGTFGNVYHARHLRLGRAFAIKVPHPHHQFREEYITRFTREAKSLAALHHPNIVQMVDFVESPEEGAYMVMEWVEGETLSDYIKRKGSLSPDVTLRIFEQLLDALSQAHELGIVHRDIKPGNIFVLEVGEHPVVKILDFGIALLDEGDEERHTKQGTILGSIRYMAPEQVRGDITEVDARSDLYACALILAECLTGQVVYQGRSTAVVVDKLHEPLPTLSSLSTFHASPALEAFFAKGAARDSSQRYNSAVEFLQALKPVLGEGEGQKTSAKVDFIEEIDLFDDSDDSPTRLDGEGLDDDIVQSSEYYDEASGGFKHAFEERPSYSSIPVASHSSASIPVASSSSASIPAASPSSVSLPSAKEVLAQMVDAKKKELGYQDTVGMSEAREAPRPRPQSRERKQGSGDSMASVADQLISQNFGGKVAPDRSDYKAVLPQFGDSFTVPKREAEPKKGAKQQGASAIGRWAAGGVVGIILLFAFSYGVYKLVLGGQKDNGQQQGPGILKPDDRDKRFTNIRLIPLHKKGIVTSETGLVLSGVAPEGFGKPLVSAFGASGGYFAVGFCKGMQSWDKKRLDCGEGALYGFQIKPRLGGITWLRILRKWDTTKWPPLMQDLLKIGIAPSGGFLLYGMESVKKEGKKESFQWFVQRFDEKGVRVWKKRFGRFRASILSWRGKSYRTSTPAASRVELSPIQLVIGESGKIYILGRFRDAFTFQGNTFAAQGKRHSDLFVLSLASDGTDLWAKTYGGAHREIPAVIELGKRGQVYIAGTFRRRARFGEHSLKARGRGSLFLAELSPGGAGKVLWARSYRAQIVTRHAHPVLVIRSLVGGDLLLAGGFRKRLQFGTKKLEVSTGTKSFVARFNRLGYVRWLLGGAGNFDTISLLQIYSKRSFFVAGTFYGHARFGKTDMASWGEKAFFVARVKDLEDHARWEWVQMAGAFRGHHLSDMWASEKGKLWVAGEYSGQGYFAKDLLSGSKKAPRLFLWDLGHSFPFQDQKQLLRAPLVENDGVLCPRHGTFARVFPYYPKQLHIYSEFGELPHRPVGFCIPAAAKKIRIRQRGFLGCTFRHTMKSDEMQVFLRHRNAKIAFGTKSSCHVINGNGN